VSSSSRPAFPSALPLAQTSDPASAWPLDVSSTRILQRLGPALDRFFRVALVLLRRSRNGSLPSWIADSVDPGGSLTPADRAPLPLPAPELIVTEQGLRLSRLGRPPIPRETPPPDPDPALRHLLERDAWMAVFWCPSLRSVWSRELRESNRRFLEGLIPRCWLADAAPLPHQAVWPGLDSRSWTASRRPDLTLRFPAPGGPEGPRETVKHQTTPEAWLNAVHDAETRAAGAATMLREHVPCRIESWEHPADSPDGRLTGAVLLRPDYARKADQIELAGALALLTAVPGNAKRGETVLGVAPCSWVSSGRTARVPPPALSPGA